MVDMYVGSGGCVTHANLVVGGSVQYVIAFSSFICLNKSG